MTYVATEFTWNSRGQYVERPVKEFHEMWEALGFAQKFPSIVIRTRKGVKNNERDLPQFLYNN